MDMTKLTTKQLEKKRNDGKIYYKNNKERIDEKHREYYKKNKSKAKQYYIKYNKEYYSKNKERMRIYAKKHQRDNRKKLIILMGGKCVKCGFADERALQIDHIKGGGYKERQANPSKNFNMLAIRSVQKGEGKFQLLCANCNWIKRNENDENRKVFKGL